MEEYGFTKTIGFEKYQDYHKSKDDMQLDLKSTLPQSNGLRFSQRLFALVKHFRLF